jgi:flagellin-like protein
MEEQLMKRKGISPLIAAVLLIAFTMAVAAILTAWVTTFTQETTSEVGESGSEQIACSFAGLSIYDAVYTVDDDALTVAIANTGTRDLSDGVSVVLSYADGSVESTNLTGLNTGEVQSVDFESLGISGRSELAEVRAASTGCPQVTDQQSNFETNN